MNRRYNKLKKISTSLGLYTEQEMARICEYEKLRTDRNGMSFSHVVLELDFNLIRKRSVNVILGKLLKQLRVTDHIGWENTRQIGIFLPGTDEVGANHFKRNLEQVLGNTHGIKAVLSATYPLPDSLMKAVSSSVANDDSEVAEAEEVSILPFKVAR